jgi:hypothetical protein
MEKESERHHYIPCFYIKNFCNSKGIVFINNKQDSRDYDNITAKVPKKVFFEWNRNTFEVNDTKTTVIEKIYRDIEDKIAPHLSILVNSRGSGNIQIIDVDLLRNLIYLGYLTKWRVPINDKFVNKLNSYVSFDDLNIFAKIENDIFSLNDVLASSVVPEIKRLIFPTLLFRNTEEYAKVFKNTFIISFEEPLFLTDNPFVELLIEDEDKEFPSFIFPLSSNLLLVYCDFIDKIEFIDFIAKDRSEKYLKYLYNSIQITLMWHGLKYIGCEDKDYLQYYLSVVSDVNEEIEKTGGNPVFVAFSAFANFKMFI